MSMTVNELVNHIAVELPDGVGLCICIEGGANWIELGKAFSVPGS